LSDVCFTDLVLLVGTNPLPNFVTAKYFLDHNPNLNKIWLVYSKNTEYQQGTRELADSIKDVITEEFQGIKTPDISLISLSNVSSAEQIAIDIKENLLHKISRDKVQGVHLNYTGGTKAMSVHVYRKLEHHMAGKCSFSYLDARDYSLKDDVEGPLTGDLRETINISLPALMKLHGCVKKDSETKENAIDWSGVLDKFENIIERCELHLYLEWVKGFLEEVYYNEQGLIKKKGKFLLHNRLGKDGSGLEYLRQKFEDETPEAVKELLQSFPREHSLIDDKGQLWVPDDSVNNSTFKKRLAYPVGDFLHGKWLEFYVEKVLKDNIQLDKNFQGRNIPVESSWEIYNKESKKPFELDVVLINGYQVCGISCTTSSNEALCKGKGFEVLHRVNQIGGGEARAVLITCLSEDSAEKVAEDLRMVTGSAEKKLLVTGMTKLKKDLLWKELSEHIWFRR